MSVRIECVYNNKSLPESDLRGSNGLGWYLEFDNQKVLFDVGYRGGILLHNMEKMDIHPDDIDTIIFSHAHLDHTSALPSFLDARTTERPVKIVAHPAIQEQKRAARLLKIGLPKLSSKQQQQIDWRFERLPLAINPCLYTTGEIAYRPEKDGTGRIMQHYVDGKWEQDPILDDQSLVLYTENGLVIICGCCHAGLLNTCNHVKQIFDHRIIHILGGIHTRSFPREEIDHIANILRGEYDSPKLTVGHCTGRKQTKHLRTRLGDDIVEDLFVGSAFTLKLKAPMIQPVQRSY